MPGSDHHNADELPGNSVFLNQLAQGARKGSVLWTAAFIGNPDGHPGWGGAPYEGPNREAVVDGYGRQNSYFSVAALRSADGHLRRTKACFDRLLAVVVDDADPAELLAPPSWVLETSPGRYQVGFFIDREDEQAGNAQLCTQLVTRLASKGLIGGDKSGNNIARYVRLPVGQNQKPRASGHWDCKLKAWAPAVRYSLEDAAAALGINLDEVATEAASQPQSTGAFQGDQADKLAQATAAIIAGQGIHDGNNIVAASLIASGAHPGAVVNMVRGLFHSSLAPRDHRWQERYDDIPRSVSTAFDKFSAAPLVRETVDPLTGEITKEDLLIFAEDALLDMEPAQFVVDGYLEDDALSMMYGPSGCGKSFIALDLACCVATGTPWHGIKVKQGPVVVIAGEGHNGLRRRLGGWQKNRGVSIGGRRLLLSKRAVPLSSPHAGLELAAEIDRMVGNVKPVLIIVDTVARNYGPGDENSTKDMSAFITAVDQYLVKRYGAHVMLVHHTGHQGERARGSSALKAALDQEFSVSGSGGKMVLSCTKMKDAEEPLPRMFAIEQVQLGMSADGVEIKGACAVLDGNPAEVVAGSSIDGSKITGSMVIQAFLAGCEGHVDFQDRLSCSKTMATTVTQAVAEMGFLAKPGEGRRGWYKLTEAGLDLCRSSGWTNAKALAKVHIGEEN